MERGIGETYVLGVINEWVLFNALGTGDTLRGRESLDIEGRPKIEPSEYASIESSNSRGRTSKAE